MEKKIISEKPIRIATVYNDNHFANFVACDMSLLRWLRISEALVKQGFAVDMILNLHGEFTISPSGVGWVSYADVCWKDYDVVKTLFHSGFESLCRARAEDHPFIISKLGSVVGSEESTEGVYFFGDEFQELMETQQEIARCARFVTLLTQESEYLWHQQFGDQVPVLQIPTGVDSGLPRPTSNPYIGIDQKVAVYVGNIYSDTQIDVNLLWQDRLNRLGSELKKYNIRLCLIGPGNTSSLNPELVTYLGSVDQDRIWDYFYFADVGISLAQGEVQHNESSKIYYYLRTGLPVVSEEPIPNNWLLDESDLGIVVPYNNPTYMARKIYEASEASWDFENAINYMINNHSWERRASLYRRIIDSELIRIASASDAN
ncbi:MAG: glycosyltransferase involved in cell wall biosynthesis [Parasphingorhabdus sp.]|jgi:glycosyltransferase involved in cell wall biosynthesis